MIDKEIWDIRDQIKHISEVRGIDGWMTKHTFANLESHLGLEIRKYYNHCSSNITLPRLMDSFRHLGGLFIGPKTILLIA